MKSRGRERQRREEKKEDQRRERARRKKMQVRQKVEKPRIGLNTRKTQDDLLGDESHGVFKMVISNDNSVLP